MTACEVAESAELSHYLQPSLAGVFLLTNRASIAKPLLPPHGTPASYVGPNSLAQLATNPADNIAGTRLALFDPLAHLHVPRSLSRQQNHRNNHLV